jgi:hypothetical protein
MSTESFVNSTIMFGKQILATDGTRCRQSRIGGFTFVNTKHFSVTQSEQMALICRWVIPANYFHRSGCKAAIPLPSGCVILPRAPYCLEALQNP